MTNFHNLSLEPFNSCYMQYFLLFFFWAGFNPCWNESLRFTIHTPELALVRFVVEDYDTASRNDFIGQYTLPFTCIQPGRPILRTISWDFNKRKIFSVSFINHANTDLNVSTQKSSFINKFKIKLRTNWNYIYTGSRWP